MRNEKSVNIVVNMWTYMYCVHADGEHFIVPSAVLRDKKPGASVYGSHDALVAGIAASLIHCKVPEHSTAPAPSISDFRRAVVFGTAMWCHAQEGPGACPWQPCMCRRDQVISSSPGTYLADTGSPMA